MVRHMVIALMLAAVPASALARPAQATPPQAVAAIPALGQRAAELVPLLNGGGDSAALFAPAFLAQVPDAQVRAIAGQLRERLGKALSVAAVEAVQPNAARIRISYERGIVSMNLAVEAAAPNRIIGLLITGTTATEASLDAVVAALKAEPGLTGFTLARLGDGAPVAALALDAERPAAIGSAFKLAILAELIRATNAGERHWDDLVTLDGSPLPGGLYTAKPAGTKVTLRELSDKMISVSDNSATDILLALVGRAKVEAMLPVIGWHDATRNRPMLSTLDMFKLKGVQGGALGRRWATLDEKGKRALLAGEIAAAPLSAIDPQLFRDGKPLMLDLEWFASAADMVRTMNWIRRNTERGAGAEARRILAINSGVGPAAAANWTYVGYKGGSEPGVISMNFLLQAKDGGWYALSASRNDAAAAVDEGRFVALMTRAVELAAAR
ncbi:serine hydrolase [Sphingomonas sp. AR_OL41]|uniref:serine hydrolase n=1 Tax=Sphingomonas sp. AR_OL41 TaxID=3042729 RepID=UPI00248120BA|nr:serine hydrolase [Sphingomonas sp. AR_OL41]MDH7973102.1 serine hydrolase [Sphingomonas sp. AR_OL41]